MLLLAPDINRAQITSIQFLFLLESRNFVESEIDNRIQFKTLPVIDKMRQQKN